MHRFIMLASLVVSCAPPPSHAPLVIPLVCTGDYEQRRAVLTAARDDLSAQVARGDYSASFQVQELDAALEELATNRVACLGR
jgi:hypothetical protein